MAYSYDGYLRFNTEVDQSGFNNGVNSMKSAAAIGAKAIAAGITVATGAITAMSVAAVRVGSDFESSMSKVAAISGATGDDLQALSDKAKEMGATTQFSATQSADALQYMAMAGWDAQQSISGLPGVMNLAAASGEDLASVSDIVTDAITAFGLQASDSAHFADVLAAAASSANTDVSKMGYTFKYAAPLAGALGYSIEDTAVAIGLMANAGIKSETAGTALRTMFSNMTGDVQLTGKELGNYTLKMQEADGTMVPLSQTMGSLREAFSKMTEAEKLSNAEKLVGKEAMSGLLAIVNASEADYNKLTGAIQNADGAAEDMAKTVNDNLKGDLTILGSTAESVGIKVYEKFQLPMRNAAQEATSSLNKVLQSLNSGQLDKSVDKIADAAGDLLAKTAELAADGIPKLLNGFTFLIDHGEEVTSIIAGATAAFVSYKTAIAITTTVKKISTIATEALAAAQIAETAATGLGTKAWVLFNAAIAANPIGLAAIALGALAATVVYFNSKQEETVSENQKVIDSTNEEIEAWEKAKEARLDNVQAQVSELETTQDMIDELENLTDAEGKVGDNKARVAYLVEKINDVLPDSIKWIDDETLSIDNNIESLKRQIKLKEAKLLLDAMEQDAIDAKETRMAALEAMHVKEKEIAAEEEEIAKSRNELAQTSSEMVRTALESDIKAREKNLEDLRGKFEEKKKVYEQSNYDIDNAGKLAVAIQEEDYEEIDRIMAQKELQLKAAGDSTDEELKSQIASMQADYDLLRKTESENSSQAIKDHIAQIGKQLDKYKAELDRRTPELKKTMESNGENVTLGFANGLITPYALTQIQNSSNILADTADKGVRARLQIKSPSRVAMATGGFYPEGFAKGVIDNKYKAVDAVRTMSDDAIKTAKEKATSYKEIGSIYIDEMKDGIDAQKDSLIDQVEKIVDAQVEAFGEENEDAKSDYEKAANELMDTYKEALQAGADEANALVAEKIQGITEEAQKQYDEIIRQRDRMQDKLSDFGDLFTRDEDGEIQLENINKQTDAIKRYQEALEELQDKGISEGLLNEILDMGVEDGTDFAEKLLKNNSIFEQYNEAWTLKQEAAKEIAQKFYADELETLDEDFTQKLDTALASIPEEMTNVGVDAIQGVIEGMNSQKSEAVATAKSIADAIIKELKRATETASPSKRAAREVGKPITQGVIKGMNDAYDPRELQAYTDKMMLDIGSSQAKAAAQSVSYMNTSSVVSNSTVYNEAPMQNFFNFLNGNADNVKQGLRESEFYRRQRAWAVGGV